MLHPNQFQVNEAWIAFKLKEVPVATAADGDFNVITLMDAASCFILGSEFVPADSAALSALQAKRLIKAGESHKGRLPGTLFIPADLAADALSQEAERRGVTTVRVATEQLLTLINDARKSFKEHFGGRRLQ
jgi:hypothetical protein